MRNLHQLIATRQNNAIRRSLFVELDSARLVDFPNNGHGAWALTLYVSHTLTWTWMLYTLHVNTQTITGHSPQGADSMADCTLH